MRIIPAAAAALAAIIPTGAAVAGQDVLCGRRGDIADLLLGLQKPSVESLWRDKTLFVLRDRDDGSLWAFSVRNAAVHPAVRCRRRPPDGSQSTIEAGQICTAGEKACASFASRADARFAAVASDAGASGR